MNIKVLEIICHAMLKNFTLRQILLIFLDLVIYNGWTTMGHQFQTGI